MINVMMKNKVGFGKQKVIFQFVVVLKRMVKEGYFSRESKEEREKVIYLFVGRGLRIINEKDMKQENILVFLGFIRELL